jgi:signal transduction histidine kinase/DNA-binding response OmpR family regulator
MTELNHEQYKKRVEELGQAFLDVISSISLGNFDVKIDVPEDIEVFADLAVGLEFMIEDLRELAKNQASERQELEQKINARTEELERAIKPLSTGADPKPTRLRSSGPREKPESSALTYSKTDGIQTSPTWLPNMDKAISENSITNEVNGHDIQALSLPIRLQDEIIGVLGFNRTLDQPWTPQEIATVETIAEQLGLALENQRLFEQTQSALSEADTLYKATAELNTAQNYNQILGAINKYSELGKKAVQLHIGLFESPLTADQQPDSITVISGIPDEINAHLPRTYRVEDFSNLVDSKTLDAESITFVKDITTDSTLPSSLRDTFIDYMGAKSVGFIPLVVGGQWIGFIDATYEAEFKFPEEEIRRTSSLSSQAAVAIQNLRSLEVAEQRAKEAQQRSEELALINRIVSAVTASTTLQDSLKLIAEELNEAISVDETSIAMFSENFERLTQVAFVSRLIGLPSMEGGEIPLTNNEPISRLVRDKKPIIISRSKEITWATPIHDLMDYRKYFTLLLMPMTAGTEVIGVIIMGIQDPQNQIDRDELRLAETILLQASTAIQNARLLNQTQIALKDTASLYQANKDLNAVQTHSDILDVLKEHTIIGQKSIYSGIFLFDTAYTAKHKPGSIYPITQSASNPNFYFKETPIPFDEWPNSYEFMKVDTLSTIKNIDNDSRLFGFFHRNFSTIQRAIMVISAPLAVAGRWVGQIYAAYPRDITFPDSDIRRLMALSGQAAIASENINLLEETSRRANQLETAAEIAAQASSTLDTDALLNRAVNLIRDRFGYYHASIFLIDDQRAVVAASTGEAGQQLVNNRHSLEIQEGKSIIGQVCHTGEALVINDVTQNPTHKPHPLLPETRAELGIPLKTGQRITGALDVQSSVPNVFTEDDVVVLQTLADQIAISLENARSFEVAQKAVEEMREVDRLKSEFLANMSHELRTPLNSIIGFSRVILKGIDGPINDLQEQDLQAIHHSGQHLLDMINNILDLSKIEAGKMELNIEEIHLKDVIESVISTARGLVKEKPIKLITDIPETLPIVNADRTRVRQIMLNLLQNSSKFTDEGTITVKIEALQSEKLVKISVSDTGIGIAEGDQQKLFERFSQVDSSLTRKVGGSGLGLSITKLLVEMQGGDIELESEVGKGSNFWFTIPMAKPEIIDQPTEEQEEDISPDAKIIVSIDDDHKVIDLYKRYLRSHGYQVVAITEPGQVMHRLKEIQPYAITLDIMMPHKDGWQVIQEIKKDPEISKIPVIICSIVEEKDKGYQLGAVDYLVKPILEDELVAAVNRLQLPQEKSLNEILVIDDDPSVFQLIELALRNEPGYKLTFANGGFAGLEQLNNHKPDGLILDLLMPDLDGFSILETMQGDPALRNIPVIILTAADLTMEDRTRLEVNRREILEKDNFKSSQLINILENALKQISERERE